MRRLLVFLIMLSLMLGLSGCKKNEADETGTDKATNEVTTDDNGEQTDLKTLSEELALQMVSGDYKNTYKLFSFAIRLQTTEKSLKEAWDATINGMGDYIEVYDVSQEASGKFQIVNVILRYQNNGLKVSFTYNSSAKLEGLWFNYSPIEEDAVITNSYEEIKITFGEGEFPVTGILTLPKNIEKPPVVILVPGSGTHDVNEVVGANKPFRDIAWSLAEQGIASIRYNERLLLYPEMANQPVTIQLDSLDDASDAISYASLSDQIDKGKIFLVGHSLGGMMAPKLAYDHEEVAGVLILAGSPRKLEEIVLDQVKGSLENTEGVTEKQAKETMATTEAGVKAIQNLKENSKDNPLGIPASYWYSLNQIDIPFLTKELTVPMFIAQGSEDWQVYADKDYVLWQELCKDKEGVTFKLYDNLNHLFMTSNGKTDVTEYNIAGHVDQTVIDDMAQWIKQW